MPHPPATEPINQLHDTEARWFAVYTRFRREKMVRKRLSEKGMEIYLPLQKVARYYTRKVVHNELPLISCYVFAKIVRREYVPVLEDPDVLYLVRQRNDLLAIPEREINILKAVTGEGIQVEVIALNDAPAVGDEVEIISGSLYGMRGFLLEARNQRTVVIELEQLGVALHLQLPMEQVRKTGKKRDTGGGNKRSKQRFDRL